MRLQATLPCCSVTFIPIAHDRAGRALNEGTGFAVRLAFRISFSAVAAVSLAKHSFNIFLRIHPGPLFLKRQNKPIGILYRQALRILKDNP